MGLKDQIRIAITGC